MCAPPASPHPPSGHPPAQSLIVVKMRTRKIETTQKVTKPGRHHSRAASFSCIMRMATCLLWSIAFHSAHLQDVGLGVAVCGLAAWWTHAPAAASSSSPGRWRGCRAGCSRWAAAAAGPPAHGISAFLFHLASPIQSASLCQCCARRQTHCSEMTTRRLFGHTVATCDPGHLQNER